MIRGPLANPIDMPPLGPCIPPKVSPLLERPIEFPKPVFPPGYLGEKPNDGGKIT
jgi:hypothetical protein